MTRTSLTIQENELRGRRGARCAMRCNEILSVKKLERRAIARNLMRGRDQTTRRIGQNRCMQHLANVASRLGALGVMVQKRNAGYHVEKHHAAKHSNRLARELRGEEPGW